MSRHPSTLSKPSNLLLMAMDKHLTLAVAGSRKTQGIVDACAAMPKDRRVLVLTYTTVNQNELRDRLSSQAGDHPHIEVAGWFSFLISNFVRPFLPFLYSGKRVRGFDFSSPPQRYLGNKDWNRYFNQHDEVRKVHLPQLVTRIEEASGRAGIRRLERMYDQIFIDEVQDLCGYDLEILKLLMSSRLSVEMVGDIRQAILATNQQEVKNKQFKFMNIWKWFQAEEAAGRLTITQRPQTWRCRPEIALLADSLFDSSWDFQKTLSLNSALTGHDGVFLVRPRDVGSYLARYEPLALRDSVNSAKAYNHLSPMNIGVSKGLGVPRVLIFPTGAIQQYIQQGKALEPQQAAKFYVAITRAEQSAAIVLDKAGNSDLPIWDPELV